jgi:hypothetical protein
VSTAAITDLDESAGITRGRYHYTRVVSIAGRTVRARIQRDFYPQQSCAVAEVLAEDMTWTHLADDPPSNWIDNTPPPSPMIHAATELGPVAARLIGRATEILAPPPTILSPHVLQAVGALLATSYGYNAERRINPDDIAWASRHGGRFRIIEHHDGSVTFTKEHRDACPFLTSAGARDCDGECSFEPPTR